jgi:hypothetical protein
MTKIIITISVPQRQLIGVEPNDEVSRELAQTAMALLQQCSRFGEFYSKFAAYTIKNFRALPGGQL